MQQLVPAVIGAPGGVLAALLFPLLDAVRVRQRRFVERGAVVREGVSTAKEMSARLDVRVGIAAECIVIGGKATQNRLISPESVGIEDEFFIAGGEASFEPAGGVQHEVGAA